MFKRLVRLVVVLVALPAGAFLASAQEEASSPGKKPEQRPVKYEAEADVPKDKAGEKRRDYAVLEATLNDLASPKNPEYKYHIKNVGPGREIVIDDNTYEHPLLFLDLADESHNIDNKDARSIPADIRDDFKRRNGKAPRSLADFKPANPNILVRDLDVMFKGADDPLEAFRKKYPEAWGFVWAYPPGYSKDGESAVVVFEGGPNGQHGLNWVYMLARKGKRWEVQWRHCRPRE